jgi:hypothetical protein
MDAWVDWWQQHVREFEMHQARAATMDRDTCKYVQPLSFPHVLARICWRGVLRQRAVCTFTTAAVSHQFLLLLEKVLFDQRPSKFDTCLLRRTVMTINHSFAQNICLSGKHVQH